MVLRASIPGQYRFWQQILALLALGAKPKATRRGLVIWKRKEPPMDADKRRWLALQEIFAFISVHRRLIFYEQRAYSEARRL